MTLSYYCQAIWIIAGRGDKLRKFPVRRIYLERSPTIQDWIRDPNTIPPSMQMDGDNNIYLSTCDSDIVEVVWRFLCDGWIAPAERAAMAKGRRPVFWVQVYKLAICLAIEPAAAFAIDSLYQYLDMYNCTAEVFIEALLVACSKEETVFQSPPLRDWIVAYLSRNRKSLGSSPVLDWLIRNSSEQTSEIVCMLMTVVAQLGQEMQNMRQDLKQTKEELEKTNERRSYHEAVSMPQP